MRDPVIVRFAGGEFVVAALVYALAFRDPRRFACCSGSARSTRLFGVVHAGARGRPRRVPGTSKIVAPIPFQALLALFFAFAAARKTDHVIEATLRSRLLRPHPIGTAPDRRVLPPPPPLTVRLDLSRVLFALAGLALVVMVVLPLGWLVVTSFAGPHGPTLDNYVTLFTDATMIRPFLITLGSSAAVAALCVLVAVPMGWCVARTDMPLRRMVRILVIASLVTPPFLGAIAWELLAAPNTGFLNQLARAVFHLDRSVHPFNVYSVAGLTFVNFLYTFPYAFVFVANALERIRPISKTRRRTWARTPRRRLGASRCR